MSFEKKINNNNKKSYLKDYSEIEHGEGLSADWVPVLSWGGFKQALSPPLLLRELFFSFSSLTNLHKCGCAEGELAGTSESPRLFPTRRQRRRLLHRGLPVGCVVAKLDSEKCGSLLH